ncbi:MAG TPA: DegT/DnrJ/EryC1/StrS family aminotransferase, partial [Polyangiaceae bacterium]|nr:DegT/DnrJ/EryC1/StrS family aminotransferase [Polyangiaceae bacterium]
MAAFIALFGTVQQTVVGKGEGYRVTADFDDVSGLVKQSRVTMAGIPIGTIDEIQLIVREDGSTKARVFIRIKPDVALYHGVVDPNGVLKNCASVTRRTATMLGDYYLDIAPGVGGERLQDGEAIPKVVGEAGFMALAGKLEEALSDRTKAVMLAHTLGNPFDLGTVKDFCEHHNLWLIEDNCDALGSKYGGKLTGSFGDIGTSSFYPPHHITMGEGGAVYTNNALLHKIVRSLRDWGRDCMCPSGVDNLCGHRFDKQYGELPPGYDH